MATPTTSPTLADDLSRVFRGPVLGPDHPNYDDARGLYNGMIDRSPAAIVRCSDAADVMAGVGQARDRGLDLAVRGGGHNGAGLGTVDDGLVLDLSPMQGIRVSDNRRTVRVQGGCRWGDVDHATHAFGGAVPNGVISTTGVGGLTLGGGTGYLSRKYGLTIDNLLSADLVLADGSRVVADDNHHEDLFWAIRGGGGNFGVATSFEFRVRPVHTVVGGPTLWSLDQAGDVLSWYREFILNAPEDLYGFFAFLTVPPAEPFPESLHLEKMCGVVWCWTGDPDDADDVFAPVREVGRPALFGVHPMPFPVLQSVHDALLPPGLQWYWRADFVTEIPDEAIERHLAHARVPTVHSAMHMYPIDGAPQRVPADATAFSYRDANWNVVYAGIDPDPANAGLIRDWAVAYQEDLHPFSTGGAYVNFLGEDEREGRVRAAYRDNYERLARIKGRYDPDNVFHVNQNIEPAQGDPR